MLIEPGHRIGDFYIGEQLLDHHDYHKLKRVSDNEFEIENLTIKLNEDERIHYISTSDGSYDGISTGMTFIQIIEQGHQLMYDEFDQLFYLKSPEGLCIEKKYENLNFVDLLNSKVQFLTVYDIKTDKNNWDKIKMDFKLITKQNLNKIVKS